MHDTAMQNAKRFFETYVTKDNEITVMDIGAQNITGSLKDVCPKEVKYIGVDFIEGKGVDIILEDPYKLPFESESIDIIVSSSCFEHSEMFWVLYLEILRILKPSGLFYLNVPANGRYHRHPVDCWRFYPDSGKALAKWAQINGVNAAVLESYTSNQIKIWNDYVCIFIKDEKHSSNHPDRILNSFSDFTNGFINPNKTNKIINESGIPEDQKSICRKIKNLFSRIIFLISARIFNKKT